MSVDRAERPVPSPYNPGYGVRPPVLAGRTELLGQIRDLVDRLHYDGRTPPSATVIVGPRGVGKSVLLGDISAMGRHYGWVTVAVQKDAATTLDARLIMELRKAQADLERELGATKSGRLALEELVVSGKLPIVEVQATLKRDSRTDPIEHSDVAKQPAIELTERLRSVSALVSACSPPRAVVVTIDEAHEARREEFASFGSFAQEITSRRLPFIVAIAGLESLDLQQLPTYFNSRADRHRIGALSIGETHQALLEPARNNDRPFDAEAGEYLVQLTRGQPFAVQVYGDEAWRASADSPRITLMAARTAAVQAARRLDRTLHRDYWQRASEEQRRYLIAVAQLETIRKPFTGGDVARSLGYRGGHETAAQRARLIEKGALIYADRQLLLATAAMADFVLNTREQTQATPGGWRLGAGLEDDNQRRSPAQQPDAD